MLRTLASTALDRRNDSKRATDRRRAAEAALLDAMLLPSETPRDGIGVESQALLLRALRRLLRQEGVAGAVAWVDEAALPGAAESRPQVAAALPAEIAMRVVPTRAFFDALARAGQVHLLADFPDDLELKALAAQGIVAAAPVAGLGAQPAAVLLLYPARSGRPLRPRTLAVLGEIAAQLGQSMGTQIAIERLGRMDEAVARLDRLAALGGLVSEIVHEIRNPLVAVKTLLQLLPERRNDPEFYDGFRELVGEEVGRLERMLDDLLRHARPRSTPAIGEGAHLGEAAQTTLQLLQYRCRERGIDLETRIARNLPALGLSPDALRQLLLNLLLNATQVTPRGGAIRLEADWSPVRANHVALRVEDDGPGIAPELAARIFEPFWTRRSEGAGGLGLAICKRIVEDAGGSIEVQTGAHGGACLHVELPFSR
ncbi:MAG: ATP-binding protein [Myxococcota bacterium]